MIERAGVVIVGAGPAGIAAACAAREAGAEVLVVDDNLGAGGQIWRGSVPAAWAGRWEKSGARLMAGARAVGFAREGVLLVERGGEGVEIGFESLILATGARERFLPFPGWTVPGVMGVGGLQAMAKSGLEVAGKRVVVAGSGPLLVAVAVYLKKAGARVLRVAEQADWGSVRKFLWAVMGSGEKRRQAWEMGWAMRGIPYSTGSWVTGVSREGGELRVELLVQGKRRSEVCDYVACGFGLVPNTELAQLAGCGLVNGFVRVDGMQRTTVGGVFCAGEPVGIGGLEAAVTEGTVAGFAAAGREELGLRWMRAKESGRKFERVLEEAFALRGELKELAGAETIVCRCEDVRLGELAGYLNWREMKLQTRCGMGACQGRVCGAAMEFLRGVPMAGVRVPVVPVSVGVLAGVGEGEVE